MPARRTPRREPAPTMRSLGGVLVLALAALVVALRAMSHDQAAAILEGEASTLAVMERLRDASLDEMAAGGPHPGLRPLLHVDRRLRILTDLSDPRTTYASDGLSLYGLRPTAEKDEGGATRHGFVLRAWPEVFGVTGHVEWQVVEDGVVWQGQNRLGRSGTSRGFPPPFPEPGLVKETSSWIRASRPEPR